MADDPDRRLNANQIFPTRKLMAKNFIGGIAWGVGSVIGATIVVAFLVMIVRMFNYVPGLGDVVSGIIDVVEQNQVETLKRPTPAPTSTSTPAPTESPSPSPSASSTPTPTPTVAPTPSPSVTPSPSANN